MANKYVTPEDIGTFLNVDLNAAGTALLNLIIPGVEDYAETMCGRKWTVSNITAITEVFDGGGYQFVPKVTPIASVVSITVDGQVLTTDEYYVYAEYIEMAGYTAYGNQNVEIVYKTAANTIPSDLKLALIEWAAQIFKSSSDAGKVATSVSSGPVSIQFLAKDGIPAAVDLMIKKYRFIPIA